MYTLPWAEPMQLKYGSFWKTSLHDVLLLGTWNTVVFIHAWSLGSKRNGDPIWFSSLFISFQEQNSKINTIRNFILQSYTKLFIDITKVIVEQALIQISSMNSHSAFNSNQSKEEVCVSSLLCRWISQTFLINVIS